MLLEVSMKPVFLEPSLIVEPARYPQHYYIVKKLIEVKDMVYIDTGFTVKFVFNSISND